jgi:hypothetical protein
VHSKEVEQNARKPESEAMISSSIECGVISRVESLKMSEPIDAKLQLSSGNLVSSKHDDLLGMLPDEAVMDFPYIIFRRPLTDADGDSNQTITGGVMAAPHDLSDSRALVVQDSPRGYRSKRSIT